MKGERGMAVQMPCYGWIKKSSGWDLEEDTQPSLSISVVSLAEPSVTASPWPVWIAAWDFEPYPE